jgi:ribosomal protein S18 acetylase RimI-like enzyme
VSPVRRGVKRDVSAIAQRVADQLFRDSQIEPLVCSEFSRQEFEFALATSVSPFWVDDSSGHVRGHIYGAHFDDPVQGRQTWSGPDGYSYEFESVLDNLCEWAFRTWRESGSNAHLVWALAGNGTQAWIERGYRIVSVRGATALNVPFDLEWPEGHSLRGANPSDLPTALSFDALIDAAQGVQLEKLTDEQRRAMQSDIVELLEDPDSNYYLLDVDGRPAAQCVTFPLPPLRGNFDHTIYVGSLAVDPSFRRQGIATMLLHAVLNDAINDGFQFAEVRWHIENEQATSLWSALGFHPTYVQLRRPLND